MLHSLAEAGARTSRPVPRSIEGGRKGQLQIVTSAISLIEVIKLDKGPLQLTQDKERKIREFFQHEYIIIVQVTRRLAEEARSLIWGQGLRPRDSIHAATAIGEGLTDF